MRRVSTVALTAATSLALTVGITGAVYSASATTHASFSTGQYCDSNTYDAAVAANHPDLYWPHGSASADSTGSYSGSVAMPVDGGMTCSQATTFKGTGALTQKSATTAGTTFTVETWFRSSSTQAAQIVGYGNSTSGNSTNRERVLYVDSTGHAAFPVFWGWAALTSPSSIVDGQWHYLALTYKNRAVTLYVDGHAVASTSMAFSLGTDTGYWRAGTDTVAGMPGVTSSGGLTATLDNTAVYPTVLTSPQISAHWTAAGN